MTRQTVRKKGADKPLVSVIIPVFNGSSYLEETVDSVIKSTYKNSEVLLIDDGSRDESKEICHKLEKKYQNVRLYSFPKNNGLGRVLNFGLEKAKGELIFRINQDDITKPERMRIQVDFLQKNPKVVAVGSWITLFRENGKKEIIKFLEIDSEIKKVWYIVSPFSDPTVMYRKSMALQVGGYKQEFWPGDDTHLWYRMGKIGKLANIQKPLVAVRFHKQAGSVLYFKKLAVSTYKMHRWANKNISRAFLLIQLYWIIQLVAGFVLPAETNWAIYRYIKKIINFYLSGVDFLTKTKAKIGKLIKVIDHPKKFNLSGT